MIPTPLDDCDLKILDALQRDAAIPRKRLAEWCHISEATCSRRIASLTKRGFLTRQAVVLDPRKLGLTLSVYVLVTMDTEQAAVHKRFTDALRKLPAVLTISYISGDYDYLLHLLMRDMEQYQRFAEDYLAADGVRKYTSLFEMKTLKRDTTLPL